MVLKFKFLFPLDSGLSPVDAEYDPNETIDNLEVVVSLHYNKMDQSQLKFKGTVLKNKAAYLRDVFELTEVNEVVVEQKGEVDYYLEKIQWVYEMCREYPLYAVIGVTALVFLVLFMMG